MPVDTPADVPSDPALGFSLTANIDPGRQIVFQSFVRRDAPVEEQQDALDRALDLADHAEKRYTIKGLEIALASHEESLRKTEAAVKEQFDKITNLRASYEREWNASGKRGEFKLDGVKKANVDNQELTLNNNKLTLVNLAEQITKTKGKIAELKGSQ